MKAFRSGGRWAQRQRDFSDGPSQIAPSKLVGGAQHRKELFEQMIVGHISEEHKELLNQFQSFVYGQLTDSTFVEDPLIANLMARFANAADNIKDSVSATEPKRFIDLLRSIKIARHITSRGVKVMLRIKHSG